MCTPEFEAELARLQALLDDHGPRQATPDEEPVRGTRATPPGVTLL